MYRMLAISSLALALVLGISATGGHAAPLEPGDVASGAKWLVHIDFDAARDSKLGEHFLTEALETERAKKGLEKLHDELGIDPRKDVHGATAYGTDFTQHAGVLIIYATADKEKLLAHLKSKPDFTESKSDNGHDVYSWSENMGKGEKHTVWAAFPKTGMAVAAESSENLKMALEAVGGTGGLATSSPLLGDAPKGTIIRGAVEGLTNAKLPIQSPVVKQIENVNLAVGESDGEDFVRVKVDATGADAAKQMKSMIDGLRGMIGLQAADHPELQKLLNGLKVESEDKVVTIDLKVSADDIIKAGEKMRQQRQGAHRPNGSGLPDKAPE